MEIGSDRWNARIYASLSTASELAAELDNLNGEMLSEIDALRVSEFLDQLNRFVERGLKAADKYVPQATNTSKEKLLTARDSILSLYRICERVLSLSSGIGGVGQMQSEFALLRAQSERLLDVADWLDALSTPEETKAKFEAASAEFANGDVVPWAAFQ
jgi:hypothetical protein